MQNHFVRVVITLVIVSGLLFSSTLASAQNCVCASCDRPCGSGHAPGCPYYQGGGGSPEPRQPADLSKAPIVLMPVGFIGGVFMGGHWYFKKMSGDYPETVFLSDYLEHQKIKDENAFSAGAFIGGLPWVAMYAVTGPIRHGIVGITDMFAERRAKNLAEERTALQKQINDGDSYFRQGNHEEALRMYRLALEKNPQDGTLRGKIKKAEDALAQAAFREKNKSIVALMTPLPVVQENKSKTKIPPPMNPTSLSEIEWRELFHSQEEVARLHAKVPLSNDESIQFMNALTRRNELMAKATLAEPVAETEREQFRLTLPVKAINTAIAQKAVDLEQYLERSAGYKSPSKLENFLVSKSADYTSDKTIKYIEKEVKESLKKKYGNGVVEDFDDMKEVGKIVVRYKKDGGPAAAADTADLAIKKILNPSWSARAKLTADTSRLYSNQTHKSLTLFMDSVDNFGKEFGFGKIDRPKIEENMNNIQKGFLKWAYPSFSDKKENQ